MPDKTEAQTTAKPAVDIDPPACFYLGREYDLKSKEMGAPVMYDAQWLTTHGVVVVRSVPTTEPITSAITQAQSAVTIDQPRPTTR